MSRRFVILNQDGSYEFYPLNKIQSTDLSKSSIEMILIPLIDHPNLYFPMKPSELYNASRIHINIVHTIMVYDFENITAEDILTTEYDTDCVGIYEFANALFNLFKFRGASIYIAEYTESGSTFTFTSYPRRIHIEFFDESRNLIHEIDSGSMDSMSGMFNGDYLKIKSFRPPQYMYEGRIACLSGILFTPEATRYGSKKDSYILEDIPELPSKINLHDKKHWKIVRNFHRDVKPGDYFFIHIQDFGVYYFIDADSYNFVDERESLRHARVEYICAPLDDDEIRKYARFILEKRKPSPLEKNLCLQEIENGDIFCPFTVIDDITDADRYFEAYSLAHVISNYLEYFLGSSYYEERLQCLSMIRFGINEQTILEKSEYSLDSISTGFLKILS